MPSVAPSSASHASSTALATIASAESEKVRPSAGTLMMWPSPVQHYVHPNLAEEHRVTISFNVIIDPEHVTAIPNDHDDAKLRCCQMSVVAEIPDDEAKSLMDSADARAKRFLNLL